MFILISLLISTGTLSFDFSEMKGKMDSFKTMFGNTGFMPSFKANGFGYQMGAGMNEQSAQPPPAAAAAEASASATVTAASVSPSPSSRKRTSYPFLFGL